MPYTDPQKAKECATRYRTSPRGRASQKRRNDKFRSVPENREKAKRYYLTYKYSESGQKAIRNGVLRKYCMNLEQYEEKLKQQNGMCAFCGLPPTPGVNLYVDHDHACCSGIGSCGRCVRGLVHCRCNRLIGMVEINHPAVVRYTESYGPR